MLWCWQDSPAWVSPCYPGLEGHSHGQSWHPPLPPPRVPPAVSLLMAPGVTSLPPALAQPGLPLPVPVQPHTLSDAPALHSSSCKVEKQERSLWCPVLTNSACTEKSQQPCAMCVAPAGLWPPSLGQHQSALRGARVGRGITPAPACPCTLGAIPPFCHG